jgi:type I restriction enzyme S subunit
VLITVMATVGRCCVVPADLETAIITKHVYRITANQSVVDPYYLMHCLRGDPTVLTQVEVQTRGQTRPGINGQILKALVVPLPPVDEQREIVRRVEALFALADAVERRVAAARVQTDALPQVILARAFSGRLVATEAELARREGRGYEPASALLERIRRERAEAGQVTRRSGRRPGRMAIKSKTLPSPHSLPLFE